MSNLNKFFLCLEKNKSKSLGQKPDDLKHLMKDFSYDCGKSMKLIDEAIVANIIKSVIFNRLYIFILVLDCCCDIPLLRRICVFLKVTYHVHNSSGS